MLKICQNFQNFDKKTQNKNGVFRGKNVGNTNLRWVVDSKSCFFPDFLILVYSNLIVCVYIYISIFFERKELRKRVHDKKCFRVGRDGLTIYNVVYTFRKLLILSTQKKKIFFFLVPVMHMYERKFLFAEFLIDVN